MSKCADHMDMIATEAFFQIEALCGAMQRATTIEGDDLSSLVQAIVPRLNELAGIMCETHMDAEPEELAVRLRHS